MHGSRRELKVTRGNPERDLASAELGGGGEKNEVHCEPHPGSSKVKRATFGKGLEPDGLKQGLGEKSPNLRRLSEELLQVREAALEFKQQSFTTSEVKTAARARQRGLHGGGGNASIPGEIRSELEAVKSELNVEKLLHAWNSKALEILKNRGLAQPLSDALDDLGVNIS